MFHSIVQIRGLPCKLVAFLGFCVETIKFYYDYFRKGGTTNFIIMLSQKVSLKDALMFKEPLATVLNNSYLVKTPLRDSVYQQS